MTYVAFLRGINVGGKNITKMAALKACLENAGFDRVETSFRVATSSSRAGKGVPRS
jgi:uncharacterized protein (DUF1697 family)